MTGRTAAGSGSAALSAAVEERLERWARDRVADRIWAKDGALWQSSGKPPEALAAWMGWLDLPTVMAARVTELRHLAEAVRADGYGRAAVLGMGGSSLAPELFGRVFASGLEGAELRILDSTHPDAVRGFREWATAARTAWASSPAVG